MDNFMGGANLVGKRQGGHVVFLIRIGGLEVSVLPVDWLTRVQVSHAAPFLDLRV